jgi:N6-adenosine-specific RNA methylase IME4
MILADPPWQYNDRKAVRKDGGKARYGIGASGRYTTEPTQQIGNLPVGDLGADRSHLYMWATFPMLTDALYVMDAWGYTYKTVAFVWIKVNSGRWRRPMLEGRKVKGTWKIEEFFNWMTFYGVGFYTASNAEIVLLGTRGRPYKPVKKESQVIYHPGWRGGEHSRKPDEVQRRIEVMYPDHQCAELFARRQYGDWLCLGNEMDGRDLRESIPAYLEGTCHQEKTAGA